MSVQRLWDFPRRYNVNTKKGQGLLVKKELAPSTIQQNPSRARRLLPRTQPYRTKLATEQLPSDVQIQLVTQNITDGVMMLTTGKVDALAVSGDNGESPCKRHTTISQWQISCLTIQVEGNVIAVQKGDDDLLNLDQRSVSLKLTRERSLYEWSGRGGCSARCAPYRERTNFGADRFVP